MNRRDLLRSIAGVAALPALPAVKSAEVLRLNPEDTLVITTKDDLDVEDEARLFRTFQQYFPNQRVLVLSHGLDVKVVRR